MTDEIAQTYEDAQRPESANGKEIEIYLIQPFHPTRPIQKWVKFGSSGYFDYLGEQVDLSRHQADDLEMIDSRNCRRCKNPIIEYHERFFKKCFEYNSWRNYEYSMANGYCKECALKKATISKGKWNPSISVIRTEYKYENGVQQVQYMEDGSIIQEMTDEEKMRNQIKGDNT